MLDLLREAEESFRETQVQRRVKVVAFTLETRVRHLDHVEHEVRSRFIMMLIASAGESLFKKKIQKLAKNQKFAKIRKFAKIQKICENSKNEKKLRKS